MNSTKKSLKAGRITGFVLLVLGSILTGILVYIVSTAQSLPRLLIAGPAIIGLGAGMVIFPGGDFTYKEMKNNKNGARRLWSDAPIMHKIIWFISVIVGLAISFKIMIDQGFLAPF